MKGDGQDDSSRLLILLGIPIRLENYNTSMPSKRPEPLYLKASQVEAAVRELYQKNGRVVLSQVRNGTGFEKSARTADMLIVSTWPSHGLFVEGVEIKVNLSDLRKELTMPEKSDNIAAYCRSWYIATPIGLWDRADLLLPPLWGVIEVDAKLKAKIAKPAAIAKNPKPMDALMVCSILRNFSESHISRSEVRAMVDSECKAHEQRIQDNRSHRAREMETALNVFEETSGLSLHRENGHSMHWDIRNIGAAVRMILKLRDKPVEELKRAQKALGAGAAAIETALKAFGHE